MQEDCDEKYLQPKSKIFQAAWVRAVLGAAVRDGEDGGGHGEVLHGAAAERGGQGRPPHPPPPPGVQISSSI